MPNRASATPVERGNQSRVTGRPPLLGTGDSWPTCRRGRSRTDLTTVPSQSPTTEKPVQHAWSRQNRVAVTPAGRRIKSSVTGRHPSVTGRHSSVTGRRIKSSVTGRHDPDRSRLEGDSTVD